MRQGAKGIVVVTHPAGKDWLDNLLQNWQEWGYPVNVIINEADMGEALKYWDYTNWNVRFLPNPEGGYETGALHQAMVYTQYKEIFLIHDTMEIKDPEIFKIAFEDYEGKSYALSNYPDLFGMYLGKYRREPLEMAKPKGAKDKMESIEKETSFNQRYCKHDEVVLCEQPLIDSNKFVKKFGRENMLLENDWVKKYKGTWNRWMVN